MPLMKTLLQKEFITQSVYHLHENTPRIKNCLDRLTEEQIWLKPNEHSNSVGNLILHLCGNITQYIISSLGNKPDYRERDLEFSTKGGYSKDELFQKLTDTVNEASIVMSNLSEQELLQILSVQGNNYSGVKNIIHVVEHYSYHTGQIAYWTKMLTDEDLGFYSGIDLNIRNK